jgi:hypothetical protein
MTGNMEAFVLAHLCHNTPVDLRRCWCTPGLQCAVALAAKHAGCDESHTAAEGGHERIKRGPLVSRSSLF